MGRAARRKAEQRADRTGRAVRLPDGSLARPGGRHAKPERPPGALALGGGGTDGGASRRGHPAPSAVGPHARGGSLEMLGRTARRSASMVAAAEKSVTGAVLRARSDGASWRAIGETLGISHVAALKRYGKADL